MAVAIAVDMDAGAMAAEKMAARKPNPATNGLGSDGVDGLKDSLFRFVGCWAVDRRHSDCRRRSRLFACSRDVGAHGKARCEV